MTCFTFPFNAMRDFVLPSIQDKAVLVPEIIAIMIQLRARACSPLNISNQRAISPAVRHRNNKRYVLFLRGSNSFFSSQRRDLSVFVIIYINTFAYICSRLDTFDFISP